MTSPDDQDAKASTPFWSLVKLGVFTGIVFGAGYWYSRLTTHSSEVKSGKVLSENEELAKNQELYESVQKRLKLSYYKELTAKPRSSPLSQPAKPLATARATSEPVVAGLQSDDLDHTEEVLPDPKPPKVEDQKPSSDRLATALSKVLGQDTPDAVASTANVPLPHGTGSEYAVQVASLLDRKVAEELVSRLVLKGYEARLVQAEIPERGVVFRVRIHGFDTRTAAENVRATLWAKEKIEAITVAQ